MPGGYYTVVIGEYRYTLHIISCRQSRLPCNPGESLVADRYDVENNVLQTEYKYYDITYEYWIKGKHMPGPWHVRACAPNGNAAEEAVVETLYDIHYKKYFA